MVVASSFFYTLHILTGNDSSLWFDFIKELDNQFVSLFHPLYYFLGMEVSRSTSELRLTQTKYTQKRNSYLVETALRYAYISRCQAAPTLGRLPWRPTLYLGLLFLVGISFPGALRSSPCLTSSTNIYKKAFPLWLNNKKVKSSFLAARSRALLITKSRLWSSRVGSFQIQKRKYQRLLSDFQFSNSNYTFPRPLITVEVPLPIFCLSEENLMRGPDPPTIWKCWQTGPT